MTVEQGRSTNRPGVRQTRRLRLYGTFAVLGCAVATTGCKLGSTSFTAPSFSKPSWWTLNGSSKADATGLASAPPFGGSGDIKKPSESAKPYPVTSTPSGYVINESAAAPAAAAATAQAATPQQPVVYGTTPPPAAASPATPAVAAAPPAAATPPSIAPQVGPYSTLAGDTIPPPGQPLPPIAPTQMPPTAAQGSAFAAGATAGMAADGAPASSRFGAAGAMPQRPSEAALPGTAFGSSSANAATPVAEPSAARMADARGGDPAAGFSAGGIPAEQASYGGSRYSTNTGSRFGGPAAEAGVPAAAAGAAAYGPPAAGTFPTSMPNTQVPGASPLVPPPAAPGLLQPSSAPVRRPDPVYRPGGTSSYRPSRALLADDSSVPPADGTIRAASYNESVPETVRQ